MVPAAQRFATFPPRIREVVPRAHAATVTGCRGPRQFLRCSSPASHAAGAAACPGQARERYEPRTFLGYACEDDCQRHKAGFAWAAGSRLSEPGSCDVLGPGGGRRLPGVHRGTPDAAEEAGYRWALENEIADPCECEGAGNPISHRLPAARRHALTRPAGCAEAWPGQAEVFSRAGRGR